MSEEPKAAGSPDVSVRLEWEGDFRFRARAGDVETSVDGDSVAGASPMTLLLEAVAGCTAIDVVDILRKGRQEVGGMEVEAWGERRPDPPRRYVSLGFRYRLRGEVDPAKAERAVALSLERYCSAFQSLRGDIEVSTEVEVEEPGAA